MRFVRLASCEFYSHIQKGKFHVEMTNTTPRGSDTISADDGYVEIEVLT